MNRAIGILGGTFDPIHYGHLKPAQEAMLALGLQQIRLMPNHIPPHRPQPVASSQQRLAMVHLAAGALSGFAVDDRELRRQSPSFTFDTLRQLRAELPDTPLCFLMGMDSLISLPTWHRWRELTDYAHLVVSVRPGWDPCFTDELQAFILAHQLADHRHIHQQLAGGLVMLENVPFAISASELRRQLAEGTLSRHWLPEPVAEYIEQEQIYRHNMV